MERFSPSCIQKNKLTKKLSAKLVGRQMLLKCFFIRSLFLLKVPKNTPTPQKFPCNAFLRNSNNVTFKTRSGARIGASSLISSLNENSCEYLNLQWILAANWVWGLIFTADIVWLVLISVICGFHHRSGWYTDSLCILYTTTPSVGDSYNKSALKRPLF